MKARRIEELVYSNYVHNNYPFQGKHQPTYLSRSTIQSMKESNHISRLAQCWYLMLFNAYNLTSNLHHVRF